MIASLRADKSIVICDGIMISFRWFHIPVTAGAVHQLASLPCYTQRIAWLPAGTDSKQCLIYTLFIEFPQAQRESALNNRIRDRTWTSPTTWMSPAKVCLSVCRISRLYKRSRLRIIQLFFFPLISRCSIRCCMMQASDHVSDT